MILRHNESNIIQTDLDPIEDILNLMTTLKSKGFTSDLLRNTHHFNNAAEIKRTSQLISLHVENALGLAKQAFDGPPTTSFLPLYYSTLNFIKVYLLILGKRTALESNRWHGAKYTEKEMKRQFLNERIKILNKGTIPLIYETISGNRIGQTGIEMKLEEIYSCISSISAEYSTITGNLNNYLCIQITFNEDAINGHYLKIHNIDKFRRTNPPSSRQLKSFTGLTLITTDPNNPYYTSRKFRGNVEVIKTRLVNSIKRYLLNDQFSKAGEQYWYSMTPISGRRHVFNEELCILLAYFHLSNVVRYNPEHLYKLMDSKYWAILLGLRKHGYLRFLKLMWGNYNKTSFEIT